MTCSSTSLASYRRHCSVVWCSCDGRVPNMCTIHVGSHTGGSARNGREGSEQRMAENRAERSTEDKMVNATETRGLDRLVIMSPVVEPEPVAPAPAPSGSTGDNQGGGGTAPVDFDG